MTLDDTYKLCKLRLADLLSEEHEDKKFLFVVDSARIAFDLIFGGFDAVSITNDEQLREMCSIFESNQAEMMNANIVAVCCCSKRINYTIAQALGNADVLINKAYDFYRSKKSYYEANEHTIEERAKEFTEELRGPEEGEKQEGFLKLNPQNGLIVAKAKDNSYRDIAKLIIEKYDIVMLGKELRIRREGRFYSLYTPEENERVLIKELDNSASKFRGELYRYIKHFAPKKEPTEGYIPFLNCLYDYEKGDTAQYTEDMYFIKCIPHNFNPQAECVPVLKDFLTAVACGDREILALLFDIFAYCLLEGNPWQKMFFIYGRGGNGKGTFFNLLSYILGGDNVVYKNWKDLGSSRGRYGIEDKFLIICNDENNTFVREPQALKTLASCEPQSVKQLYADEFTVVFRGKILSCGNAVPKSSDTSNGWLRRLILIPFDGDFTKNPDINLTKKLCTEEAAEYLILHAVKRLKRVIEQGFTPSRRSEALLKEYIAENDHVVQFIEEVGHRFEGKDNSKVLDTIYGAFYTNFCNDYGYERLNRNNFAKRAKAAGLKPTREFGKTRTYYIDPVN